LIELIFVSSDTSVTLKLMKIVRGSFFSLNLVGLVHAVQFYSM